MAEGQAPAWDARDSSPPSEKIETAQLLVQQLKAAEQTRNDYWLKASNAETEAAALRESHPKCAVCGKPASCMGSYESDDAWDYSCDECCVHGNEDGVCYPLADVPARFQGLMRAAALEEPAPEPEPCGCEESVWLRAELARAEALANSHAVEAIEGREREGRLSRLLAEAEDKLAEIRP